MGKSGFIVFALLFVCVFVDYAFASLVLSNTLGSNMVLQQSPAKANIWGWADAGSTVTITFNAHNYTQTAAVDTSFKISLPATAAGGPYTIAVTSSSGGSVTLTNVMFGHVFLCSGQSNMQFTVPMAFNNTAEELLANNYPNIRLFTVSNQVSSSTPLSSVDILLHWSQASQYTVGEQWDDVWSAFSAVCWFTGRNFYDAHNIPIGLIDTSWGGSPIEAWSTATALATCGVTGSSNPYISGHPEWANTKLWNSMIYPFLNMQLGAVLWYQGETNQNDPTGYTCMFPTMITDWRTNFGNQNFPFLFVQLHPYVNYGTTLPDFRQAQLSALFTLPAVGFAVAADLGDIAEPYNWPPPLYGPAGIHPRNKQTVGERLALVAREMLYGELVGYGPTVLSASQVTGSTLQVTVTFDVYTSTLVLHAAPACPDSSYWAPYAGAWNPNQCTTWQIQLSDGNWYAVSTVALVGSNQIRLSYSTTLSATGVRYAYSNWPLMTVYNAQGLPAYPFSITIGSTYPILTTTPSSSKTISTTRSRTPSATVTRTPGTLSTTPSISHSPVSATRTRTISTTRSVTPTPTVVQLYSFENTLQGWVAGVAPNFPSSCANPTSYSIASHATSGSYALRVQFEQDDAATQTTAVWYAQQAMILDLSAKTYLSFDIYKVGQPFTMYVALSTGASWVWFQSAALSLPDGGTTVTVNIKSSTWASAASGWANTASVTSLNNIQQISIIFLPTALGWNEAYIDNIRAY